MKKIALFLFYTLFATIVSAQERVNTEPANLSYKSKNISKALYWMQSPKTGNWESRRNTFTPYLGEGVSVANFYYIFIGEYAGHRYLFIDYKDYFWRYPNLEMEWCSSRHMIAGLLSDDDYHKIKSIKAGEVATVTPSFYNNCSRNAAEQSFPFFLTMMETLRGAAALTGFDELPKNIITIKRVQTSPKNDVIRFRIYPDGSDTLIDHCYFEIDYTTYLLLFTPDKTTEFKWL